MARCSRPTLCVYHGHPCDLGGGQFCCDQRYAQVSMKEAVRIPRLGVSCCGCVLDENASSRKPFPIASVPKLGEECIGSPGEPATEASRRIPASLICPPGGL